MRHFLITLTDEDAGLLILGHTSILLDKKHLDVTDAVEGLVDATSALGKAVQKRMEEFSEAADEALERLTANYTRAEIEEGGFTAAEFFLDTAGITYTPIPEDPA